MKIAATLRESADGLVKLSVRAVPGYDVSVICGQFGGGGHKGAAGAGMEKVVKTTCFLADMGGFAAFNEVYATYFTSKPARSCVAVKTLPKNVLCEVELIAVVEE